MSDEENYEGVVGADDFDQTLVGDDNVDDAPEPEGGEARASGSTYTQYAYTVMRGPVCPGLGCGVVVAGGGRGEGSTPRFAALCRLAVAQPALSTACTLAAA